jgi:hypothetical protein
MFRKDIEVDTDNPYVRLLSDWHYFGDNATVANTTLAGFEFGPESLLTKERCAYINSLLTDPANGV